MSKQQSGFTLIELMVVLAILGIVVSIAVPSYQSHMRKVRRTEGTAKLHEMIQKQERYFTNNNTYTTTLGVGGLEYTVNAARQVVTEKGFYNIAAAACGAGVDECVILTATAQGGQAADGNLTLNSLNQKTGNWD